MDVVLMIVAAATLVVFWQLLSSRQTVSWSVLVLAVRLVHAGVSALDSWLTRIDNSKAERSGT